MASPASSPGLPRTAPWVALASIGVVAGLTVVGWPRLERWRGHSRAEEARATLTRCLGATDDDALRARAIETELSSEPWPETCLEPSATLEVALRRVRTTLSTCHGGCCVDDADCQQVEAARAQLERLRDQMKTGQFHGGVAAAVLDPIAQPRLTAPPPKATDLPPLTENAFDVTALAVTAEGPTLLLHQRGKRADRCVLDLGRAGAHCEPLPASIPVAGEVLLVDGAPSHPLRLMVSTDREGHAWSLRDATGEALVSWTDPPVSATFDAALVERDDGYEVLGATDHRSIASGTVPLLYGEHVYRAAGSTLERRHRWDPDVVDAVDLTGVAPGAIRLQPCHGERGARIVASGDDGTGAPASAVVFDDGGLTVQAIPATPPWFGLTCHDRAASLTWIGEQAVTAEGDAVRGRYQVTRVRCEPSGCVRAQVEVELVRHRRGSRYVVADLGEAVALVWRSSFGDVRLRVGPLDDFASAPTVSLFDDAAHGGLAWDGRAAALVPGDGYAVLVAQSERGLAYGWLVRAQGATPLRSL